MDSQNSGGQDPLSQPASAGPDDTAVDQTSTPPASATTAPQAPVATSPMDSAAPSAPGASVGAAPAMGQPGAVPAGNPADAGQCQCGQGLDGENCVGCQMVAGQCVCPPQTPPAPGAVGG